mgnify:FL=1
MLSSDEGSHLVLHFVEVVMPPSEYPLLHNIHSFLLQFLYEGVKIVPGFDHRDGMVAQWVELGVFRDYRDGTCCQGLIYPKTVRVVVPYWT